MKVFHLSCPTIKAWEHEYFEIVFVFLGQPGQFLLSFLTTGGVILRQKKKSPRLIVLKLIVGLYILVRARF